MIVSKKLIFSLLFFSLMVAMVVSFSLSFFSKSSEIHILSQHKTGKNDIQGLISSLHSKNPLTRRDAISVLGKGQEKVATLPLFSMMMSPSISDVEAKLVSEALYNITQGKILEYAIPLLSQAAKTLANKKRLKKVKDIKKTDHNILDNKPLTDTQVIHLLGLLEFSNKEDIEKSKYNLDFLALFFSSENTNVVLATFECISALSYSPLFNQVKALFDKNLYYQIPVMQIITKIGLNFQKYYAPAVTFIRSKISQKNHPNVQEESYLAFYMLNQHLLDVPEETEKLMQHIVGLDSNSLSSSLSQEYFLLTNPIPQEEVSLVKFFLSDVISPSLRFRLLNILWQQGNTDFLDTAFLIKTLQERYMDRKGESAHEEMVKTALQILADRAQAKEDLTGVLNYISDPRLSFTVVAAVNRMLAQKKNEKFLSELYSSLANDTYSNIDLDSWVAYLGYRLHGQGELVKHLVRVADMRKLSILHDLADCNISPEDIDRLKELYANKGEAFQSILSQISAGYNTCFFG